MRNKPNQCAVPKRSANKHYYAAQLWKITEKRTAVKHAQIAVVEYATSVVKRGTRIYWKHGNGYRSGLLEDFNFYDGLSARVWNDAYREDKRRSRRFISKRFSRIDQFRDGVLIS